MIVFLRDNKCVSHALKTEKTMRHILSFLLLTLCAVTVQAQWEVKKNGQHAFPKTIPAGNYSGIAWLEGSSYAVVSDKSAEDGFFIFDIQVDSVSGEVQAASCLGFRSSGHPGRDNEGVAYNPATHTIWICGESDNRIMEYDMGGKRTGRQLHMPSVFAHLPGNLGLEALSYNAHTETYWTCNEADSIVLQSFGADLQPKRPFRYQLEAPVASVSKAQHYAHGVGTVCALDDGSVLLLEREFYVPKMKVGAFVSCKLFRVTPDVTDNLTTADKPLEKQPLTSWRTSLSLLGRSIANYEGMCLGPALADGSRVLLLVADSQNQYAGVLKDWITSVKVKW